MAVVKGNYLGREPPTGLACAPTVSVATSVEISMTGLAVGPNALQRARDRVDEAIRSRITDHACLRWSDDPQRADLRLEIRIQEHVKQRVWMTVLSGFTLMLVPAVATTNGTATVAVLRGETPLASRTWQDRTQIWIQLFLVFAMPAASPTKAAERSADGFGDAVVGLLEATIVSSPGLTPRADP